MRVLGIDPGISNTGVAIMDYTGSEYMYISGTTLETPTDTEEYQRVGLIAEGVKEYLEGNDFDAVAIEECYFNKNVSSANSTNRVIGAIQALAADIGLPLLMVRPQHAKQALGLTGTADKKLMRLSAKRLFRFPFPIQPRFQSHHEIDAAAIAVAGILHLRSVYHKARKDL